MQLYACLTGAAKSWFDSLSIKVQMDVTALFDKMRKTFKREGAKYHYYRKLLERKQKQDETVDAYAFDIINKLKKANDAMDESEKLNYFIQGLNNKIQAYVITKSPKTIEQALDAARKKEAANYQISLMQPNNTNTENEELKKTVKELKEQIAKPAEVQQTIPVLKPSYRPKYDSRSAKRAKPVKDAKTCNYCGKIGHFARDCFSNPQSANYRPRTLDNRFSEKKPDVTVNNKKRAFKINTVAASKRPKMEEKKS